MQISKLLSILPYYTWNILKNDFQQGEEQEIHEFSCPIKSLDCYKA